MDLRTWTALLAFVTGLPAGAAGRVLLRRLRRGTRVPPPWCELAVAGLWALAGWLLPAWWLPVPLALAWFGVLLAATDLAHRRLPDALTLPAYPVVALALCCAALIGPSSGLLPRALLAGALFFAAHLVIRLASPVALGAGDVKLSGVVGAALGAVSWPALLVGALAAATITALLTPLTARGGLTPHGPGLLAATYLLTLVPP
ncbi:hypothetical protein GCM10010174_43020 [Kutzneria viridogrisea]|uniref:Leader peptidase (Prepilin peptidase)/N-methyltransferase n=2 Tax=Kutzneria TaxID=43356 RepID=A0ABR6BQ48_9PSEU|nr:A24 family peptidase [Kutzneria albida]MBA8928689.1 leader peptidase (prepilin peptidase)/N-methyltransferase [Kutzneria viridogrisea]